MLNLATGSGTDIFLIDFFSIFSSGGFFVQWSGTTCAMLKEGIMGNIKL